MEPSQLPATCWASSAQIKELHHEVRIHLQLVDRASRDDKARRVNSRQRYVSPVWQHAASVSRHLERFQERRATSIKMVVE